MTQVKVKDNCREYHTIGVYACDKCSDCKRCWRVTYNKHKWASPRGGLSSGFDSRLVHQEQIK